MKQASWFPFGVEPKAAEHFKERLSSLFRMNDVRIMQLLELVQYGLIYFVLGFGLGAGLEILFPEFNEEKATEKVILEALGQVLLFVIVVFYLRKIAKLVPFMFVLKWDMDGNGRVPAYKPYRTTEYAGEMTIALVLIASQANLLKKVDLLSRKVYEKVIGFKREVKL